MRVSTELARSGSWGCTSPYMSSFWNKIWLLFANLAPIVVYLHLIATSAKITGFHLGKLTVIIYFPSYLHYFIPVYMCILFNLTLISFYLRKGTYIFVMVVNKNKV